MMRLLCAVLLLCWIPCLVGSPTASAAPTAGAAEHLAVLFVIDDSGSMEVSDPHNLRYDAAALFTTALDAGDSVGALSFATGSRPITGGMIEIAGEAEKQALIALFAPAPADGYTDVKAAFEAARAMLPAEPQQGVRTVVIFLTDGKPEVPDMPSDYSTAALAAAKGLGLPVYAVALTPAGQTSFLAQLAAETGGRVIPAARAGDLVDSFLAILAELKDRTVLGQAGEGISIDPGLAPYISKATFIAIHPAAEAARLVAPDGSEPGSEYTLPGEETLRITLAAVNTPMPGAWRFASEGGGGMQVRAVLHSRLRAALTAPSGLVEAGQPVTITAELLEEQAGGEQVKILGDAAFSARVTLSDGSQESLDALYDDGTHGDLVSGDGVFSRQYPNTAQSGTYHVDLLGRKGPVPVSASARFEVVNVPELVIAQPGKGHYELRGETVPLAVMLPEDARDRFQGGFAARVTAPSGQQTVVPLVANREQYAGAFTPVENGPHTVTFEPLDAAYLGIPYGHAASAQFTARLIPAVTVERVRLALERDRYELAEAREGIPVEITWRSSSPMVEPFIARVEGAPGFAILEPAPLFVPPGESTITLRIAAPAGLEPGERSIDFVFQPAPETGSAPDLLDQSQPLAFSLYQPVVSARAEVIAGCLPGRCWQQAPVRVILHTISTSPRVEQISLRLEGLPGTNLSRTTADVPPGEGQVEIELRAARTFAPGTYSGALVIGAARDGMAVEPASALPLEFAVPSVLQACQTPLIFSGSALLAAAILVIKVRRAVRAKAQPPLVKGTLRHWRKDAPGQQQTVDLTALKKEGVTIGSGPHCDVIVTDAGLEAEHARISAERAENGVGRYMLTPLGRVTAGYKVQSAAFELQEQVAYQMGEQVFTFLRDAEY